MKAYFDSAIIAKLYVQEVNSDDAISLLKSYPPPTVFTALHESEIKNAIRLKCCRKEISQTSMALSLKALDVDAKAGVLHRTQVEWLAVFRRLDELSERFALVTNCRTLDAMHVACAIVLGVEEFVTFDQRQRDLAKRAGMKVKS